MIAGSYIIIHNSLLASDSALQSVRATDIEKSISQAGLDVQTQSKGED